METMALGSTTCIWEFYLPPPHLFELNELRYFLLIALGLRQLINFILLSRLRLRSCFLHSTYDWAWVQLLAIVLRKGYTHTRLVYKCCKPRKGISIGMQYTWAVYDFVLEVSQLLYPTSQLTPNVRNYAKQILSLTDNA